ncbi:MAG: Nucleolar protein 9 [Phylliscum demangeonii]|nr:MAG: Nucleolar protein 9 [Phylliscum demangeonii]
MPRVVPASFAAAARSIVADIAEKSSTASLRALAIHPLGNPVLQLLLELELRMQKATPEKNGCSILQRLLAEDGSNGEIECTEFLKQLLLDTVGSYLLETIVEHSAGKIFKLVYRRAIREQMIEALEVESASFVIMRVLQRLGRQDVQDAICLILPQLHMLAGHTKSSILLHLIRCSAKRELSLDPIAATIDTLYGIDGPGGFLQNMLKWEESSDGKRTAKYNATRTQGSLLAQEMLRRPGQLSKVIHDSLAKMPAEKIVRMAEDPAASHVLEKALAEPASTPVFRRLLIANFFGNTIRLASSIYGAHVLVFAWEGTRGLQHYRERLIEELCKGEREWRVSFHGRMIWKKWRLDLYKHRRHEWLVACKAADQSFAQANEHATGSERHVSAIELARRRHASGKHNLVFVHGLRGHPLDTWKKDEIVWPRDLLPDDVPNARILTFGYQADAVSFFNHVSHSSIFQHAQNLLQDLQLKRRTADEKKRPIIFIGHSLGGLVIKDALCKAYEYHMQNRQPRAAAILVSTTGVIFLGTPHRGSSQTAWAKVATRLAKYVLKDQDDRVIDALKRGSEVLERLQDSFAGILHNLTIYSFFEDLAVTGVGKIVDDDSATIGCANEVKRWLSANHMDMCKFDGRESKAYERDVRVAEYKDADQWSAARKAEVSVLETRRQQLGDHHPTTLLSVYSMARIELELASLESAKMFAEWAWSSSSKASGREDPFAMRAECLAAEVKLNLGKLSEAEELVNTLMVYQSEIMGLEHFDTMQTLRQQGLICMLLERDVEAQAHFQQRLDILVRVVSETHPLTSEAYVDVADNLIRIKTDLYTPYLVPDTTSQAVTMANAAYDRLKETVGARHQATLRAGDVVSQTMIKQGQYTEALVRLRRSSILSRNAFGAGHPFTQQSALAMATCYLHMQREEEARRLYLEVSANYTRVYGPNHPRTLLVELNLGQSYLNKYDFKDLGRFVAAGQHLQRGLQGLLPILGAGHSCIKAAQQAMEICKPMMDLQQTTARYGLPGFSR